MRWNPEDTNKPTSREQLPDGEYPFVVLEASDSVSKKGNPMIVALLGFDVGLDRAMQITEWLTPAFMSKLREFCRCVGHDFSTGEMEGSQIVNRSGVAQLVRGEAKKDGKRYMEIAGYQPREGYSETPTAPAQPAGDDDTSIPF